MKNSHRFRAATDDINDFESVTLNRLLIGKSSPDQSCTFHEQDTTLRNTWKPLQEVTGKGD